MLKVKAEEMGQIEELFAGIEDSMVIACLQGTMGEAFANRIPAPDFAMIVSGEYSFFGGDWTHPEVSEMLTGLFDFIAGDVSTAIYADTCPEWGDLLVSHREYSPQTVIRYGIAQKDYHFDEAYLVEIVSGLPDGYELTALDAGLYRQALIEEWSKEFCETFASAEDYLRRGFGFAVLNHGEMVAGASTMTVYDGGAETQVATKQEHQGKGLAMVCAAAFILEAQKRGIRPCWDAANLISKHMALRLGYEYRGDYTTVVLTRPRL